MEVIRRLADDRCGERPSGLRVLQIKAVIALRAMREQEPSVGPVKQDDRIFVRIGAVITAIDLAQNLPVLKY